METKADRKNQNPRDLVTQADKETEAFVTEAILKRYPDHAILGEENGTVGNEQSDTLWVVDPLDGTSNFFLGSPDFAFLIAMQVAGEVVCGVTYFPATDELFVAEKGVGAFKNGEPLRGVRSETEISSMFGSTQMSSKPDPRARNMAVYERLMDARQTPSVSNMHVFNACLARGLCDIADGINDFHFKAGGYNWWDYAAGKILVEEAGGIATDIQGHPLNQSSQSAFLASRAAHKPLLDLIQST
jgi:myo-inositol-1(or 4)-monophosphatase